MRDDSHRGAADTRAGWGSFQSVKAGSAHVRERLRAKQLRAPSLDWLNFLVADVRGALGPYVVVFLVSEQHWDLAAVGLVTTLGGWAGLLAQTPIGAWLDHTNRKRGMLLGALAVLSLGAVIIVLAPSFWPVLLGNGLMQVVSGVFEPGVAALTVGLFAREALTRRIGRNAAWARAGNVVVAISSGGLAWLFSSRAVFLQVPAVSVLAAVAVLSIPYDKIDQQRARGLESGNDRTKGPAAWLSLLQSRPLLVFAACSFLYELADAPLLTLVAQNLGVAHQGWGMVITSAFIVSAQAGMLSTSIAVGRRGDAWGYRWLLAVGFAMLPVQAVLTAVWHGFYWLVAVQFFGGLSTGLLAALTPLWLADVMRGTGHYNLSQGAVATLRALGVTTSGLVSELLVARMGYDVAYLGCGIIGAIALALLWFALPDPQPQYPLPLREGAGGAVKANGA